RSESPAAPPVARWVCAAARISARVRAWARARGVSLRSAMRTSSRTRAPVTNKSTALAFSRGTSVAWRKSRAVLTERDGDDIGEQEAAGRFHGRDEQGGRMAGSARDQ